MRIVRMVGSRMLLILLMRLMLPLRLAKPWCRTLRLHQPGLLKSLTMLFSVLGIRVHRRLVDRRSRVLSMLLRLRDTVCRRCLVVLRLRWGVLQLLKMLKIRRVQWLLLGMARRISRRLLKVGRSRLLGLRRVGLDVHRTRWGSCR
jgi:hypothetical protein